MAFEKAFTNQYHDLALSTKYRFAEIEINQAVKILTQFFRQEHSPRQKANDIIYNALAQNPNRDDEYYDVFQKTLLSTYFNNPPKSELVHYLIMKGHSYNKIRNLTGVAFNTIANMRYGLPSYQPIFTYWNEEALNNWNAVKHTLNLFSEELAHTKGE